MQEYEVLNTYSVKELHNEIMQKVNYCWDKRIGFSDVEVWLSNFTGKVYPIDIEQKLALMLLSNFIYISDNEMTHLCIHAMLELKNDMINRNLDFKDELERTNYLPIESVGKSGPMLLYKFGKLNNINSDQIMEKPTSYLSNSNFVFIDDIAGSGDQASKHLIKFMQEYDISVDSIIYLPFLATTKAISKIENTGVRVVTPITLDDRMKVLNKKSYSGFNGEIIEMMHALLFGYSDDVNNCLGYSECQLALGFSYNTPDNSLPIFWSEEKGWKPIFNRYNQGSESQDRGIIIEQYRDL